MTIGIIGAGAIGTAFARTLARAGVKATISNSRGPESLSAASTSARRWLNAFTTRAPVAKSATTWLETRPCKSTGLNSGASIGLLASMRMRPDHLKGLLAVLQKNAS